jgi:hypothetical protein
MICRDSDLRLADLARLPEDTRSLIDRIHLEDHGLSQAGVQSLASFPKLRALHFKGVWNEKWSESIPHKNILEELWLQDAGITEKSIIAISRIKTLKVLMLDGNQISGKGLADLSSLHELRQLSLSGREMRDDHLAFIGDMRSLSSLQLGGTSISDKSVPLLKRCRSLKVLELTDTKLTVHAIDELRQSLPEALISGPTSGR